VFKRINWLKLVFTVAGGMLVIFILLPLLATLFATSPAEIGSTFSDQEMLSTLGTTFLASGLATFIGLLLGLPLAYLLARYRFPAKSVVEAIVDLPIVIPHTAAGLALLMVFGSKGLLGYPLSKLGMFFVDTLPGIVVGMLFVSLPYLVRLAREAITQVDRELERMALLDGANPWQSFFLITIPLAWRGIISGAMMMWARGISEFGAVIILAYHPKIVPTLIYERFEGFGLSAARPVAVVLIIVILFMFTLLRMLFLPDQERLEGMKKRSSDRNNGSKIFR
jgi:molybdate/tungstate transport system permease protein